MMTHCLAAFVRIVSRLLLMGFVFPVALSTAIFAQAEEQQLAQPTSPLPSLDQLMEAKLGALRIKQTEQEQELSKIEALLAHEQALLETTFDHQAYLSLSMINSAPPLDYRLDGTEIYVDGRLIGRGGKRNRGLPRAQEVFFGAVAPGCHEIVVKAKYTRLKNDLVSRFKVNRIETLSKTQAFIAKSGHRVEIEVEGFEAHNTFANWYRGPALRFNKSARPNFLPGAPIVSMDDVLKQGHVKIDYITEDQSQHRLLKKSVSIDGMPILVDEKHDAVAQGNIIFDAPLREGKHTLNVTLLFAEKKWVAGGPSYNFRLSFDRHFYVISGQTTIVNLAGMPKGGIKSTSEKSRYARATSKIVSQEYLDLFPLETCQDLAKKQAQAQKAALPSKKEE